MITTTETLLSTTVYGQASGNYDGSSQLFYGDPVIAAGYYKGVTSVQTITISVTGVQGTITVQATLNDNPAQASWFDVGTYGDGSSTLTDVHSISALGNFCYMRVRVDGFDAGTINSVLLVY